MIDVIDSRFEGVRLDLDDIRYVRCTFLRCEIVYRGGSFGLENCHIDGVTFIFEGAAGRTVEFLKDMSKTPGGADLIESTFDFLVTARRSTLQ